MTKRLESGSPVLVWWLSQGGKHFPSLPWHVNFAPVHVSRWTLGSCFTFSILFPFLAWKRGRAKVKKHMVVDLAPWGNVFPTSASAYISAPWIVSESSLAWTKLEIIIFKNISKQNSCLIVKKKRECLLGRQTAVPLVNITCLHQHPLGHSVSSGPQEWSLFFSVTYIPPPWRHSGPRW